MRILVAVDGSNESLYAARAIEHLSHANQVTVLHALNVPRVAYPLGGEPTIMEDLSRTIEQSMREDGERLLERVSSLLLTDTGPLTKRIEKGSPAEVILSVAEKDKADLIVLGSRGLGPVKELLLGSVSHRVVTHALCPTLVVNRPVRSLRHVLLAVQGPEDAAAMTAFLARRPFRNPVELTVLTALPFDRPLFPAGFTKVDEAIERFVAGARSFVEKVVSDLGSLQISARERILVGAPAVAILEEATAAKPDLILMGSHGRRGITRFVLGSVSHAVLHRSPCPVLIVR